MGAIRVIGAAKRLEEKSKESLENLETDITELVGAFAEAKAALKAL